MTWTAPEITRTRAPRKADERTMLEGWLTFHRQTLLHKCAGLTAEQLKTASVEPSNLTLLGLVRHMAEVERWWFRTCFAGEQLPDLFNTDEFEDGDFDLVADADAEADHATFGVECALADEAAAGRSLDDTFQGPRAPHHEMDLRWVYVHMIEEYARHNGHADLIRQRIDGRTGE
ncbi:DinB family protein [Longispora sp. K20-0274]|uniref:DinB family protein n=1 Tax=Longispora sp. K20-0274 TaxID=3088255 RepID=UPI00399A0488